jgi:hypothetical protein
VHQGFAKILNIAMGMPAVFAKPYASRSQHISSEKIAHIRFYNNGAFMAVPFPNEKILENLFRLEVFKFLKKEGKITA